MKVLQGIGLSLLSPLALGLLTTGTAQAIHKHVFFRAVFTELGDRLNLEMTHTPKLDHLEQGASKEFTLELKKGIPYVIMGLCDDNCKDLDLALYSPEGRFLDNDYRSSEYAAVGVLPTVNGTYRVKVKMYRCSVTSCDYGLGVFSN